jgi:hypothetical protein
LPARPLHQAAAETCDRDFAAYGTPAYHNRAPEFAARHPFARFAGRVSPVRNPGLSSSLYLLNVIACLSSRVFVNAAGMVVLVIVIGCCDCHARLPWVFSSAPPYNLRAHPAVSCGRTSDRFLNYHAAS